MNPRPARSPTRVPTEPSLPDGLSNPARRALANAGYARVEDLAGVAVSEVLALHGVGPKAIPPLRAALAERGLAFAGE